MLSLYEKASGSDDGWGQQICYYKLNVACKCCSCSSTVGVGIIIRDSLRLVAAVMETTILCCGDMLQIHAEAAQLGIKFAFDIYVRLRHYELVAHGALKRVGRTPLRIAMQSLEVR